MGCKNTLGLVLGVMLPTLLRSFMLGPFRTPLCTQPSTIWVHRSREPPPSRPPRFTRGAPPQPHGDGDVASHPCTAELKPWISCNTEPGSEAAARCLLRLQPSATQGQHEDRAIPLQEQLSTARALAPMHRAPSAKLGLGTSWGGSSPKTLQAQ